MIDSYSLVASVDRMTRRSFFPSVLSSLYTRPVCHGLHHSTYVLIFLFEFVSPELTDSMQKKIAEPAMSNLIPMHAVAFPIVVRILEFAVNVTGV